MPSDMKAMMGKPEKAPGKKKTSYLDGKSPELVSYLLEAVDGDEAKAEALCRAFEAFNAGEEAAEVETEEGAEGMMPPPGDMGMF